MEKVRNGNKKSEAGSWLIKVWREWIKPMGISLCLVLFFTTYVAQATRVPSESMKPSILAEFWPLPDSTGLLFYDGR